MPMIDVYATAGTFADTSELAKDLAAAMMRWEGVPEISLFLDNTAAFVPDLDPDSLANAAGDSNYVRPPTVVGASTDTPTLAPTSPRPLAES